MSLRKAYHEEWDIALSTYLKRILFCERCRVRRATEKAHRIKRRFIGWRNEDLDRREYFMAIKICRQCHTDLDEYTGPEDAHERMFTIVTEIIIKRQRGKVVGEFVPLHPMLRWDAQKINNYRRE